VARLNRKTRKPCSKVRGGGDDLISPFPEKPKGMHWETFLRLEHKDFEADREKMRTISGDISRLQAEGHLLRRTGEDKRD
jgi:hypothetical protein